MPSEPGFSYFKNPPGIIQLACADCMSVPLSLRNVERPSSRARHRLFARNVRLVGSTDCGTYFATKNRKRRSETNWRTEPAECSGHPDEVFRQNPRRERTILWRDCRHEGEVLESTSLRARDKAAALKFLEESNEAGNGNPQCVVRTGVFCRAAMERSRNWTGARTVVILNNRPRIPNPPFFRRESERCFPFPADAKFAESSSQSIRSVHNQLLPREAHSTQRSASNRTRRALREVARPSRRLAPAVAN